jgi:hypothetical protein
MSRRVLEVAFADEQHLLRGVAEARRSGHEVLEVHGPYPVHGLPEALALPPSRLPWVCLAFGLVGLVGGLALQAWTSAVDWPLDVGGKPLYSWPAFIPVAFELVVLLAGLGTVATFLLRERATRRQAGGALMGRATHDLFVLRLAAAGADYDAEALTERFRARCGAVAAAETFEEDSA